MRDGLLQITGRSFPITVGQTEPAGVQQHLSIAGEHFGRLASCSHSFGPTSGLRQSLAEEIVGLSRNV